MNAKSQSRMDHKSENGMYKFWLKYLPYWPLFLILAVIGVAGATVYLKFAIPQYESTATILIKDEKKGLDDSKMIESMNLITTKKIIENETEVLRSKTLMRSVVDKLSLYAPVSKEGKMAVHSAYSTSPIAIDLVNADSLTVVNKVPFQYDEQNKKVIINNTPYPLDEWVETKYGTLRFKQNPRTKNGNFDRGPLYFSLIRPKNVTDAFVQSLMTTSASKLSTIITLKIKDEVPERAEDILNALVDAYNANSIRDKNVLAGNTLGFVKQRLKIVEHELDSIEKKIEGYKSKNNVVNIGAQGQLFLENVSTNDQKVGDVNIQLAVLDQVQSFVTSKNHTGGGIVPSMMGISDPVLLQLLEKLYDHELKYESLKKTTAENNPVMVAEADQISRLKPSILENIRTQREGLLTSRLALNGANDHYNSYLRSIPQTERELVEISREQSIKRNIYSFLVEKKEEAELSGASSVPDSRIVDRAESSVFPVSPSKKLVYGFALIAAFAIGAGSLGVKQLFSGKIMFRDEIEQYTSIPVVAEIGHNKLRNALVMDQDSAELLPEHFRKLRVSLQSIGITGRKKRVLITSTIAGEGKSFIAANLALSLALIGKKVVLVEFDLIRPSLSEKLEQNNKLGIADYLKGAAEPEEIIVRSSSNENLFFISAGLPVKNPSELIMSERTEELLDYLNNAFDYVIVDCAPSGPLSDAYTLSPLCDATLYVVRHKYTPKFLVQRLDVNNETTNLKNVSIVFNGIKSGGFTSNFHGYGYNYNIHTRYGKYKPGKERV